MRTLTLLYDGRCGFCVRCKAWLEKQPQIVPLEFVPAGTAEARRRFPGASDSTEPEELVVVSDEGEVWRGDGAFLMCLWALAEWREWSLRLAQPELRPLARRALEWVGRWRFGLSRWLDAAVLRPP